MHTLEVEEEEEAYGHMVVEAGVAEVAEEEPRLADAEDLDWGHGIAAGAVEVLEVVAAAAAGRTQDIRGCRMESSPWDLQGSWCLAEEFQPMSSSRYWWLRQAVEEWAVRGWDLKTSLGAMAVEVVEKQQVQAQGRLNQQEPSRRRYGFFSADASKVRAHRRRHRRLVEA